MTASAILLVGAGGHARASLDVIEQEGRLKVGGLVGLPEEVGGDVLGYPVVGTDGDLDRLLEQYPNAIVTVGQIKSPEQRIRLYASLERIGYAMPVVVSPRAYVSPHAAIGEGTIVMHGAVVNANATVGRNCIINSQALVEHDADVADHCHISTNAAINSGARIGEGSFIGSTTCIRQGVSIGARSVIGMGQRIVADCAAGARVPPGKATA